MSPPRPAPRLFADKEGRLADLDRLPRRLWLGGLTHSQGCLEPRLAALAALRDRLAAGLPAGEALAAWPGEPAAAAVGAALASLDLPRYCREQAELPELVAQSLLFHLDFIVDFRDRGMAEDTAIATAVAAFADDWKDRCGTLDELTDVFGLIPDLAKNTRWDQLHGLLRAEGWQEVVRIRRLLERLPELQALIRRLGRALPAPDLATTGWRAVTMEAEASVARPQPSTVHVPDLPGETRGIRRSDRIARMLPAEAMLLGHPRLRLVWHARRAERTLLTYEDDDRMTEVREERARVTRPEPRPQPAPRLEMGPLLLCVDTSASMRGGAEAVAKAVVLEAMRTAHAQGRPCHLFAFGGPDEVVELSLAVDAAGIGSLSAFLGQAFRGGTDICAPLERALVRLETAAWRQADLLIASDGEFGATPALAARVTEARQRLGLHVQGVLIGDRETVGFLEIADAIHWVRDWRRFGGSTADSPVHSRSLTALYFPGALRNAENRAATVDGGTASAAVHAGRHRNEPPPESQS